MHHTPSARAMLLTPPGRGAIATVGVSGGEALARVSELFQAANGVLLPATAPGRVLFGRWGTRQPEEVVVCRTSANAFEIHCHGGDAASARILNDLREHGVEVVDWRATLASDFVDSMRAEALVALAQAATARTAAILWDQYRGALWHELSTIHAALDDGNVGAARESIGRLLDRSQFGLRLTTPWQAAIVGRPNVGKSSLLNALLGFGRAIVHEQPGTTRDLVTGLTACDGWPCQFVDTAGLRETDEPIERAGVELVSNAMTTADLVLWVRDATAALESDEGLRHELPQDVLVVWNKRDLVSGEVNDRPGNYVSALDGHGIDELIKAIAKRLAPNPPAPGDAVPFTPGQTERLRTIEDKLRAGEVAEAAAVMAEWIVAQRHEILPGEICEPS